MSGIFLRAGTVLSLVLFLSCTKNGEEKTTAFVSTPVQKHVVSPAKLNQETSYTPKKEDLSPEGFNWVHRDFALLISGMIYEHGLKGVLREEVLKERKSELHKYLQTLRSISRESFEKWEKSHQVAFLINAYHAHVLFMLLEKDFKNLSNKLLDEKGAVQIFSEAHSLRSFVREKIRKRFSDPRIFLSLYCFEKFCPEFRNRIYNYKNLETELDISVTRYIRNPDKNALGSPLLKEYEKEIKKFARSIPQFVKKYKAAPGLGKGP